MSSYGYIPPPFPFPEAWPALFQTQQTTWLTPTVTLAPPSVFPFSNTFASARQPTHDSHVDADQVASPFAVRQQEDKCGSSSVSDEEPESSDDGDDGDSSDGEYVYGYVLSDEWRNRFRASVQARQHLQQQQQQKRVEAAKSTKSKAQSSSKGKKRRQDLLSAAQSAIATGGRTMDLQRALETAKQREATQRRPIAAAATTAADKDNAELRQLETQLNLRFDEFCDAFQPIVWPHDAVH